jgi:heat shock protein HtpX
MGAIGLQTHIWNNNIRSAMLLAGFPILLLGLTYILTFALIGAGYLPTSGDIGRDALGMMLGAAPLALGVTAIWFAIAWFSNTAIIDAVTGARPVSRKDAPDLYNLLENLSLSRGLRTPNLHIIDTPSMNAFASGVHEGQYAVTVTTGLLAALDREELEAVLAHELTHIISRDVRTMVIASVFAGVITLLAQIIYRAIVWGGIGRSRRDSEGRRGGGIFIVLALAAAAIGYLLAILIRMALSRSREFVADAGAAELTKNPDAMIRALQKISGNARLDAPEAVQGMFIENRENAAFGLFETHPPIEKRIDALVRYAGGRLPEPAPSSNASTLPGPWDSPLETPSSDSSDRGPWG